MLDSFQDAFGKVLLSLPSSGQGASPRAALGLVGMKWRVWEAKILLLQAIRRQEDGGLAKEVLEEQMRMSWPGLASEVAQICKKIQLPDASIKDIDKDDIKKAIKYDHMKSVKLDLKGNKLKLMANSDISTRRESTGLGPLEYRMAYRLETKMFICRANMPTMFKRDLTCRGCTRTWGRSGAGGPVEDQDHLEVCPGYASQWAGLDPMTTRNRVQYFMRVDKKRRSKV